MEEDEQCSMNNRIWKITFYLKKVISVLFIYSIQLAIGLSIHYFAPEATEGLFFYFFLLFKTFDILIDSLFLLFIIALFIISFIPIYVFKLNNYLHWIIGGTFSVIFRSIILYNRLPESITDVFWGFGKFTKDEFPSLLYTEIGFWFIIISFECIFCYLSKRYYKKKANNLCS